MHKEIECVIETEGSTHSLIIEEVANKKTDICLMNICKVGEHRTNGEKIQDTGGRLVKARLRIGKGMRIIKRYDKIHSMTTIEIIPTK